MDFIQNLKAGDIPMTDADAKVVVYKFKSLDAFLKLAGAPPAKFHTKAKASDERGNNKWAGSESLAAALDLAVHGWKGADKAIRAISDLVFNALVDEVGGEEVYYTPSPTDYFDMGRVVEASPDVWAAKAEVDEAGAKPRPITSGVT